MLKLTQITKENLSLALETFHSIFSWIPEGCDPYSAIINGTAPEAAKELHAIYYFVYDDEELVGITGCYRLPSDVESGWLGWFGVVPAMRRNHYGSKILKLHEENLLSLGYRFSRLYTEAENNDATRSFYERNGYTSEAYCPTEENVPGNYIVIYSKTLCDEEVAPWNSKSLHLMDENKMMYSEEDLANLEELTKKSINMPHC